MSAFRSATGVPAWRYRASTPSPLKAFVKSRTCAKFTQKTRVDLRPALNSISIEYRGMALETYLHDQAKTEQPDYSRFPC